MVCQCQCHGGAPRTERVDGGGRVGVRLRTDAKLAFVVMTPALDRGVIENGTVEVTTSVNTGCSAPRAQIDGLWRIFVTTAGTKLPSVVATPTHNVTVVKEGTGVTVTEGNADSVVVVRSLNVGQRWHVLAFVA